MVAGQRFNLEYVDDIRCGIRSEIWENEAISLAGFIGRFGEQLAAKRR
jgi:hypothetical protein